MKENENLIKLINKYEGLKEVVDFHGHLCFGVALGYRVAKYAKKYFDRDVDEDLVAIVGNNSCSVDAIQYMLGCTFGKGNLIFRDYGKHVYIFYSRKKEKALRISVGEEVFRYLEKLNNEFEEYKKRLKEEKERDKIEDDHENINEKLKNFSEKMKYDSIKRVLNMDDENLFDVKWIKIDPPKKAKIYRSIKCEECGEYFMEIRGRIINKKIVCMECFEKLINEH